jgi:hypothetical protein
MKKVIKKISRSGKLPDLDDKRNGLPCPKALAMTGATIRIDD